jgi:cell division protein FtsW
VAITLKNSSRSFDFGLDRSLLLCVFSLMGIGLVLIYSASYIFATENYGDSLFFFRRQLFFTLLSILGMYLASRVSLSFLKKLFWPLYFLMILLLAGTLIPGIAHKAGGASRWINLPGGFHIEPSEITKLMAPFVFAWLMTYEKKDGESSSRFWSMAFGIVLLPVILLLGQPDFGSSVIFFLVGITLLFGFGLPWSYLFSAALCAIPAFYILVMRVDYRKKRMLSFLNPWAEMSGGGFQVVQSLLGFPAGRWLARPWVDQRMAASAARSCSLMTTRPRARN